MDRTREERMEIAQTIIDQLGGRKFMAMTGAKQTLALESGLRFQLPGGNFARNGINRVNIVLEPTDTYTVTFSRIRGMTVKEISNHSYIYAEGLQNLFTDETGLETHL